MTSKEFSELYRAIEKEWISLRRKRPKLRKGQALMNTIHDKNEEVHDLIVEAGADCFYDDSKVPNTLRVLKEIIFTSAS